MPAPCYHTTPQKLLDRKRVEWLTRELGGGGADFGTFARKCCEIFGTAHITEVKCMHLYRQYAKIGQTAEQGPYPTLALARQKKYTMLSQVPPEELEELQKLFNENAPRRCREWNCALPDDAPSGQLLCQTHAGAGRTTICGTILERDAAGGVARRCDGEVEVQAGCFVCTKCERGVSEAKICESVRARPVPSKRKDETDSQTVARELAEGQRRNAGSLQIANKLLSGFGTFVDPSHQPSWHARKRL